MNTFTPEEVDDFINLGSKLSAKTVLATLKETVKWAVNSAAADGPADEVAVADKLARRQKICDALCAEIDSATPYDFCGFTQIEMEETKWKINVSLALVDIDFKTVIDVPSQDYINDIFARYDFAKKVAGAYWGTFREKHPNLIKRIEEFIGFELGPLREIIPPGVQAGTTMCWHEEVPKRVGVFCYWVNQHGQPMVRKSRK